MCYLVGGWVGWWDGECVQASCFHSNLFQAIFQAAIDLKFHIFVYIYSVFDGFNLLWWSWHTSEHASLLCTDPPTTSIKDQSTEEIESEFVQVAIDMKGHVIGRRRCMLNEIMQKSGANVFSESKEEEGFTVCGNEEQRTIAKNLILQKVVSCAAI